MESDTTELTYFSEKLYHIFMDDMAMELLLTIHKDLPQEGPGSDMSTLKALSCIQELPKSATVLDIGCGPGRQTLALAKHISCNIVAVDIFDQYLDQLRASVKKSNFQHRIDIQNGSMEQLVFQKESFDLIWSEGAAYIMGFDRALNYWKRFLKTDGCIALTEIVWTTEDRPEAIEKFWQQAYPEISTSSEKIATIQNAGYTLLSHFTLPVSDWHQYYQPLKERLDGLKQGASPKLLEYIESEESEIDMFNQYSRYYSYAFFVIKNT